MRKLKYKIQQILKGCWWKEGNQTKDQFMTLITVGLIMTMNTMLNYARKTGQEKTKRMWMLFTIKFGIITIWTFAHPVFLALILCLDLDRGDQEQYISRVLSAVLISLSAWMNLLVLSEIPFVGIHFMMITRVMGSAMKFFLTFAIIFVAFCLCFHILLPNTDNFKSLDNAFIKIIAMLMGELDFTNSFIRNPEAGVVAKILFFMFVLTMALVFMNLLLGIAVSDINELERISKTQNVIMRCFTIKSIERVYLTFR